MIVPYSNSSIAIDNIQLIDCFSGNYELLKILILQQIYWFFLYVGHIENLKI